jgi:F1F0 ATPase subunit 2
MSEIGIIILTVVVGILLGTFFFGGLWWTVKRGVIAKNPAVWFFGSFVIRLAVTMLVFYLIGHNHWERILICLTGFLIARYIVTRFTKTIEAKQNQ